MRAQRCWYPAKPVVCVLSPTGKYIICGSEDHFLFVWKANYEFVKFTSARRDRNDYWEAIKGMNECSWPEVLLCCCFMVVVVVAVVIIVVCFFYTHWLLLVYLQILFDIHLLKCMLHVFLISIFLFRFCVLSSCEMLKIYTGWISAVCRC